MLQIQTGRKIAVQPFKNESLSSSPGQPPDSFLSKANTALIIGTLFSLLAASAAHLSSTPVQGAFFDNLQWTISSAAATIAVAFRWNDEQGPKKVFSGWCLAGFIALFLGQCVYDVQTAFGILLIPDLASPLFLLQAPLLSIGFLTLVQIRGKLVTALLDASAFGLLLLALVLTVYLPLMGQVAPITFATLVAYPLGFFILAILGIVVALERQENISTPLLVLSLCPFVIGTLWTIWNASVLKGITPIATTLGDSFSFFYLLWAAGIVHWQPQKTSSQKASSHYEQIMTMLPIVLVVACAISLVLAVPTTPSVHENVISCVVGALAIAILRQSMLLRDKEKQLRNGEITRQFQEKLLQRQRLEIIGTVTSGIAHDMRNVLTVISGNAELLPLSNSQAEADDSLESISSAAYRGQQIIQRILQFAKTSNDDKQPFAIEILIDEVQRMLGTALPKYHEIKINVEPKLPQLTANSSQIYQVLMNLAINGSHAIGEVSGEILFQVKKINTAQKNDDSQSLTYLQLMVSDSGSGMDDETLHRVFEPFFSTKPDSLGTGLGLSIVHDIVKEHQGSVAIDSQLGTGTTVTITLPI